MDTAYHPDFGQMVSYGFESMPADDDAQVRMTAKRVIAWALTDAQKPIIQRNAAAALARGAGNPITGVWASIKPFIRFRQDWDTAQDLDTTDGRKLEVVETLIPPHVQAMLIDLRGQGVEDCDGFTMYGACLLLALGVPVTICTVAADRERPWQFSHVYCVAYWQGTRIPLDFSHGAFPGWECPNLGRKREWPVSPDTLRPSLLWPLLIAGAAGLYFASRKAA